jgi:hypothetical protein
MVMAMRRLNPVFASAPRLMPAGQSVQTNDLGEFRIFGLPPGEYFVAASRPPNFGLTTNSPSPSGGIAAVFTYYPGTADASTAQPVTVGAGQIAAGIVFRILTAQTYQVSGVVVDGRGAPVEGAMVMLRGDPRGGFGAWPAGGGTSDANGHFVISGITPGLYQTMASVPTAVRNQNNTGGGIDELANRRILFNGTRASDQLDVTVTNANVEGVQVVVQRPQ